MEDGAEDHFEHRVPFARELQMQQRQQPRHEDAVLVMRRKEIAHPQAAAEIRRIERSRLGVPLIPERYR